MLRAHLSTPSQNIFPWLAHSEATREDMLKTIGVNSVEELFKDIPAEVRCDSVGLPPPKSEIEVEAELSAIASKSLDATKAPSFLGAGCYRHHVPSVIDHLLQRSEYLTAYTPYQPEVSQGTLQNLFEFQTYVTRLTGMDVANASMYDGPTACAEAVMMALRIKKGKKKIIISGGVHPHYRDVVKSYLDLSMLGKVVCLPPDMRASPEARQQLIQSITKDTSCVVVQNPTVFGHVDDIRDIAAACKRNGAMLIVAVTEPVSYGLLKSPGEMGADIVIGEGQSLTLPPCYGGPTVGYFATKKEFLRNLPGRLVGQTVDVQGKRCWVLTLGTREQHIRREKATSNICTSASSLAAGFGMHLALLGETGFRNLAELNHRNALTLANKLKKLPDVGVVNRSFFNEFTVELPKNSVEVVDRMAKSGVLGGVPVSRLFSEMDKKRDRHMIVAATELNTDAQMEQMVRSLQKAL